MPENPTANPIANPWRGEATVELGGLPYVMRPTFAALSNIEQTLGTGLIALSRRLSEGALSTHELAVILAIAVQAAGSTEPVPVKTIHDALLKNGVTKALCAVAGMLVKIFEGVSHG